MTTTTMLTEIEAINLMLSAIGEAPVNSIDSPVLSDVSTAKKDLDNACRKVQQRGWSFNTETELPLTPDVYFSKIAIPPNALRVDPSDPTLDYRVRGGFLYDRALHTFAFTAPVKVDITFLLSFADLPYHAQQYALVMAARSFQKGIFGGEGGKFTEQDELEARINFRSVEAEDEDCNVYRDTASIADSLRRG